MDSNHRDTRSNSNRSFGKPRFNNPRPDMHKATCDKCGKICEVPFRPTGSKPVFCRDCFKENEGSDSRDSRGSENRSFGRSEDRQMHSAVCAKCGNTCQIPFKPTAGRDVFCRDCFRSSEGSDAQRPERKSFDRPAFNREESRPQPHAVETPNYKAQFETLNAKMDHIITLLSKTHSQPAPVESKLEKKVLEEITESSSVKTPADKEKKPKKQKKAL